MTPEARIDASLDRILRAAGSALHHYTMPSTLAAMRTEMREIMVSEYISGSNDCHKAHYSATHNAPQGGRVG